jgi:aspartate kinase
VISGVDLDDQQARITVLNVPDRPGEAARLFQNIAKTNIYVDMIVQNVALIGSSNLSFTVPRREAGRAKEAIAGVVGPEGLRLEPEIAKISVRGVGMRTNTGVAARLFEALSGQDIKAALINTSEVCINVAVDRAVGQQARQCLAQAFFQHSPSGNGG